MSDIRAELQRAVDEALASAPPDQVAASGRVPQRRSPRDRWHLIAAAAGAVVLIAGVGMWLWIGSDPVTVTTGPAQETTADVPVQTAPRATSFTLDMPARFTALSPEPESKLVDQQPSIYLWDDTLSSAATSPRPMVTVLDQGFASEPEPGATDESLIIELSYVDELPDGFLDLHFQGGDISAASPERPLVERGPASDQGGWYAEWLDGTQYVMFIAQGMTEDEFSSAVDSFRTHS